MSPQACLPSTSGSQNCLLATVPNMKTRQLFFSSRDRREQRKRAGKEKGSQGLGRPTQCGSFSGSSRAGSARATHVFSRCVFFEVPHSGYPSALLSALALASPPARGRSRGMVVVTVPLDKLYHNLHKPQCSRCRGRLEEACFSVGFCVTAVAGHS